MDTNRLTLNQRRVLGLFDGLPTVTTALVCARLLLPRPTAAQVLQRLTQLKLIERQGQYRGTFYILKTSTSIPDQFGNDLVTVYKGIDGFRRLFHRFQTNMKRGDFYWSFAFKEEYYEPGAADFLLEFHHELARKGVEDRTIVHADVLKQVRRVYRNVPDLQIQSTKQDIPTGMSITKNEVVHLVWGQQPIAIAIASPAVVQRYQQFFQTFWA